MRRLMAVELSSDNFKKSLFYIICTHFCYLSLLALLNFPKTTTATIEVEKVGFGETCKIPNSNAVKQIIQNEANIFTQNGEENNFPKYQSTPKYNSWRKSLQAIHGNAHSRRTAFKLGSISVQQRSKISYQGIGQVINNIFAENEERSQTTTGTEGFNELTTTVDNLKSTSGNDDTQSQIMTTVDAVTYEVSSTPYRTASSLETMTEITTREILSEITSSDEPVSGTQSSNTYDFSTIKPDESIGTSSKMIDEIITTASPGQEVLTTSQMESTTLQVMDSSTTTVKDKQKITETFTTTMVSEITSSETIITSPAVIMISTTDSMTSFETTTMAATNSITSADSEASSSNPIKLTTVEVSDATQVSDTNSITISFPSTTVAEQIETTSEIVSSSSTVGTKDTSPTQNVFTSIPTTDYATSVTSQVVEQMTSISNSESTSPSHMEFPTTTVNIIASTDFPTTTVPTAAITSTSITTLQSSSSTDNMDQPTPTTVDTNRIMTTDVTTPTSVNTIDISTETSNPVTEPYCNANHHLECDEKSSKCQCISGMIYDKDIKLCVSLVGQECELGGSAGSGGKFCSKNAKCLTKTLNEGEVGKCICKSGFLASEDNQCLPGFGSPCSNSSREENSLVGTSCFLGLECSKNQSKDEDDAMICKCINGWVEGKPSSLRCYLDYGSKCTIKDDLCNQRGFLNCSEASGECRCQDKENHIYDDGVKSCVAISSKPCTLKEDEDGRIIKCIKGAFCDPDENDKTKTGGNCKCNERFEADWQGNCNPKNIATRGYSSYYTYYLIVALVSKEFV